MPILQGKTETRLTRYLTRNQEMLQSQKQVPSQLPGSLKIQKQETLTLTGNLTRKFRLQLLARPRSYWLQEKVTGLNHEFTGSNQEDTCLISWVNQIQASKTLVDGCLVIGQYIMWRLLICLLQSLYKVSKQPQGFWPYFGKTKYTATTPPPS